MKISRHNDGEDDNEKDNDNDEVCETRTIKVCLHMRMAIPSFALLFPHGNPCVRRFLPLFLLCL